MAEFSSLLTAYPAMKIIYKWPNYLIVSSNPVHGEVYSIQHYVLKFVSDLRKDGGFRQLLRFPPPIKLTATIYR